MKNTLKKRVALVAALLVGTSALTLNATNLKKQIEAYFYNIKVTHNGQYKSIPSEREPFMYNDRVYIALADVAAISGMKPDWDPMSKTVKLTSDAVDQSTVIANKNLEIAKLKSEVASLQSKLDQFEEEEENTPEEDKDVLPNISSKDLQYMIEDLTDDYEGDLDIDWIFDLSPNSKEGRLDLTISLDRSYDINTFKEITEDELEDFIDSVTYDIHKELGKMPISGMVNDHKGKSLTNFAVSKTGKLTINHEKVDTQLDRLNILLGDEFSSLSKIEPYFTSTISIDSITANDTRNFRNITIDLSTKLSSETDIENWNNFYNEGSSAKKNILFKDLSLIASYVEDYFDIDEDNISVVVYDSTGNKTIATYDADGGSLSEWK